MQNNNYKENIEAKLDSAFRKEKKSVAGFFIKNYRFTYLFVFLIVLLGGFCLLTLPREAEPEIEIPFAVVNTVYFGASPSDIEELITDKIEPKIENLDNLRKFTSSSSQDFSSIFVEFEAGSDLKENFRKLREAVQEAEPDLPEESETPTITEINFNDLPIITYSLVGNYNDTQLKQYADKLQDLFEDIKDVSRVEIIGGLEREFQVIADQTKLANYDISFDQIINSITRNNFSLPAGDIEIDGFKHNIRIKGKFKQVDELNNIVVATNNNTPIFLKDVALIQDGYKERKTKSKIGFAGEESGNTISLQIYKKTGGNILNIIENSQETLKQARAKNILPDDLKIEKTNDNSVFIKEDLNRLGNSGIQTTIMIALILMIILSFRGAIITAMSVPIAFLSTFIFLSFQGMTLNSMVLFALVLSLGLMVDNSIVIIEGINEYVSRHKKTVYEAAILSVWNYKWAIIAGTMTTVAAFAPMLLVSGIMGQYMSILPKTLSVTLLSSLFAAIIIIPTIATRFIKIKNKDGNANYRNKKRHLIVNALFKKASEKYAFFLNKILPYKKKRRKVIALAWICFIIAVAVPISGIMKIEMFPKVDMDFFIINIELPAGSTLKATEETTKQAEEIVFNIPEIDNYVVSIGASASTNIIGGNSSGTHLSNITVNLSGKEQRERKSYEIADSIRADIEKLQGAKATLNETSGGPPTGAPIEVRIFGDDSKDLANISEQVQNCLENISGVINIKDNLDDSVGELVFSIDKEKADYYKLDTASIALSIRGAIYGAEASEINIDGEDINIVVKYNKDEFNNVDDLKNILLPSPLGNIKLEQVASVVLEPSLLNISHRNGKRVALVSADIEKNADLQDILKEFDREKNAINLPNDLSIQVGGEVEDIERSFKELFLSMIMGIIFIAMILVLQFNSFKQPFIIIFSLPLAIIGVIIGLNIFQQPFSITAFIGIISLSGIVVNDAIVLIDKINKNILYGMEFTEAIVHGGISRMQPILLTSITTIVGVIPLVFANELWRGLSISIIFGLIFSTILILIIIPVMYAGITRRK